MRVGLVRNVALGMVALVGLGLAGCDDNPTDFETDETVRIFANPTVMTVPAGVTTLLRSRTENAGNEPTWEEINATVDGSCGSGAISVDVAASFEPAIEPPGQFDVTGGTTLGETCIQLSGGGASATVEVTVVGDSLGITGAPEVLNLNSSVDLGAVLLSADGTAVSPFNEATDVVWTTDNDEVMTVDADGLVTAVGIGAATITATWSDFGVTISSSVAITTNQPELEIVEAGTEDPPADSLLIFTTVDLDANLINPTDPPADFGPFDQTDVTWSSSDPDIMSVDPATGEVTAEGAGTATITVEWNENDAVFATIDLSTDIPAPAITSTDVATADALDVVTITGTDFIPGAHTVLIDGASIDEFYAPTVVDPTTATFMMPGGAAGDVEVSVGIVGIESNALTVSRTCGASDASCASEPDNDEAAGAPDLGALPASFAGYVDGADPNDLLELTLGAETTFEITLNWDGGSGDMDVVFTTTGATDFSEAECGFVTATGSVPENGECTLAAGTYFVWVGTYDLEFAFYELSLVEVP